jgi:RimJ/RimL family protein N-acetyltransferase
MTLNWMPARPPDRAPLNGSRVGLEPLDPERHGRALFTASHEEDGAADRRFRYLPYGPFVAFDEFKAWLDQRAETADPLFYAVVDLKTDTPRGMASYLRMVPEHGVIEIGHIWFSPALQRTREATEAIYLMSRHAFDDLGYRRLEWKCDALNEASRLAATRFGFTYEGTFRQHLVVKGRNRDSAWFSMLDGEWPRIRAAFEAWLAPENFDDAGVQRHSLASIRTAMSGG